MNIAITQREFDIRGWKYDCLQQDWYQFLKGHEIYSIPNTGTSDFTNIDCLILSGGSNSTNRESVERMAVEMFMLSKKPIIGICHGAFALNKFFGGTNGSIKGHQDTEHEIMMVGRGRTRRVNSYHTGSIVELADSFEPMALDLDGNVEAFRHNDLPIYGMVWHPERMRIPIMLDEVEELLRD
jgi:N5-(cytidine 5'-diphosphoramidyl)-L-glutamine hydrolase